MTEATADGTPILVTNLEISMAAGGFQFDDPGGDIGGGSGPTTAEVAIEDMFSAWSAPLVGGDEWTSYMADNAMFYDSDSNGYYDYVEISGDSGVCIYDPVTNSWRYRAY